MHKFEYHEPATIGEAAALLRTYGDQAKIMAGGTDLLVRFRKGVIQPQHVVNIKKIPGLDLIAAGKDGLMIGAAVSMYETERFLAGFPQYRVLSQAIHSVASCQIRNRATVAGNICNASPAADTLPALVVLGAQVGISGEQGDRWVAVENFFAGPGKTVLMSGEMVSGILLPPAPRDAKGIYLKQSRRPLVDLAIVGLAAFTDGSATKIALGSVAPTVVRAQAAEMLLAEKGLSRETALEAAKLTVMAATPISDIRGSRDYRLALVEVLAQRALLALCGGEKA
ncbi:MAG: xanthine dehydrogenase family protein subunit M [Negativicutes bacterium]|nr:xanthine dehydrogenase family protein subunit M [Negativicutes bacterium]